MRLDHTAVFMLILIVAFGLGCFYFVRLDWKRYGAVYLIAAIAANALCYALTYVGMYSFPENEWHDSLLIPHGLVSTLFPFIAMFGVRFSPERWVWKIPFYWGVVHLGVAGEVVLKQTSIFAFAKEWDLWDSYTLWWIFYLLMEALSGKIVPASKRKPIRAESFRYGRWAWIVFHAIVVTTIFLAGVYVGVTVVNK